MALTRAQLLAGNESQGPVLPGQPQGVIQGTGIIILPNGTINFDASTATNVMRLNNPSAYQGYIWPTLLNPPAAGTILQSDGIGNVLWTSNYVPTTGPSGAAELPAGADGSRPGSPEAGYLRFNTTSTELEVYDGTAWASVGGGGGGTITSIDTGTGLTGGPITTTGTISLANTAVTPGNYTTANITVDAQGRITAAANGGGGGGAVSSILAGKGISVDTPTGNVTIALKTDVVPVYASQTYFANINNSWSGSATLSGSLGTWNFTVPDGANQAVFIYTANQRVDPSDQTVTSGALTPAIKSQFTCTANLNNGMQFTGGQSGSSTNISMFIQSPQTTGAVTNRSIRVNLITLPGSGTRNFSIDFSASGNASLSVGGGSATGTYGGVQAYLQPFTA